MNFLANPTDQGLQSHCLYKHLCWPIPKGNATIVIKGRLLSNTWSFGTYRFTSRLLQEFTIPTCSLKTSVTAIPVKLPGSIFSTYIFLLKGQQPPTSLHYLVPHKGFPFTFGVRFTSELWYLVWDNFHTLAVIKTMHYKPLIIAT